jgi:predicted nuclease of predicted toxin-antitoxin system
MVRLLFDEPLSEELCDALADIYPDSLHVRVLGCGGAADATVWELGLTHGCLIVSKDEDFNRLAILRRAPPKFLWIRRGNCPTSEIAQLLRRRHAEIIHFYEQSEATVLELR